MNINWPLKAVSALAASAVLAWAACHADAAAGETENVANMKNFKADKTNEGCSIKQLNGYPAFYLDGRPRPLIIYRDHHPLKHIETVKQFLNNGINITTLSISAAAWAAAKDKNSFYKAVDKQINEILEKSPDILLMILLSTTVAEKADLYKNNIEEATVWPPFTRNNKQSDMAKGDRLSEASSLWQQTIAEGVFNIAGHVKNSNYSNRIVGYLLTGPPGEWTDWYDFSGPALNEYKKWLKLKYSTVQELRNSWHDGNVTFDNVGLPGWEPFFKGDLGIFFDPAKSQRQIDFLRYHHMMPANVIGLFAKKIKEASSGKHLVGAFYGYFTGVEWDGSGTMPQKVAYFRMRHKALSEILKNPDIDFIAGPYNYQERHAGGVFDHSLIPNSIILNGKMAFIEDDTRTHLTTPHPSYTECEKTGDNFGQAKNIDETLSILKRNFAGIFSKCGSGFWYFGLSDTGNKWWDDREIIKCAGTLNQIANEKLVGQDKDVSEIAVIGSYRSVFYQCFNNLSKEFITRQLLENVHRIGAPFDIYLDTDLSNPKFPFEKYKFYVFLNSFYLDDNDRQIIKNKICTGGKTVLWIYANGIVDDKSLSVSKVEDLIGIKLGMANIPIESMRCVVNNYNHPVTRLLPKNLRFGPDNEMRSLAPVLWCDDPRTEVLGELLATPCGNGIYTFRKPGICVRKQADWTSVWSPVPNVPSSLLRGIAQNAGVHIYDDADDQVLASKILLAIHVRYSGPRTIKLPRKCNVYDPFSKEYIIKSASEFTIDLKQGDTGLWLLE